MRESTKKTLLLLSLTSALVLSFQNCSKVDFAQVDGGDNGAFAKGDGELLIIGNEDVPGDLADDPTTTPPIVGNDDTATPPAGDDTMTTPPAIPPVADDSDPVDNDSDDNTPSQPPVADDDTSGPVLPPVAGDDKEPRTNDDSPNSGDDVDPKDRKEAIATCDEARQLRDALPVQQSSEIVKLRGSMTVRATRLTRIFDTRGKLVLLGDGQGAFVDLIEDHRGKLVICDMNVGEITNNRGKIVVVNGSVAKIDDARGALRISGDLGSLNNFRGNAQISGQLGSVTDVRGSVAKK